MKGDYKEDERGLKGLKEDVKGCKRMKEDQ